MVALRMSSGEMEASSMGKEVEKHQLGKIIVDELAARVLYSFLG